MKYVLSTGLFGLPGNAASVDWAVLNDGKTAEAFRVTVYRCGVNQQKTPVPPGPLTETVQPGSVWHNANSVGPSAPFVPGFYYEVVVEVDSLSVLPTVEVWQDHGNTVIAGTTILPKDFTRLK